MRRANDKFDLGLARSDLFFAWGLDRKIGQRVICPSGRKRGATNARAGGGMVEKSPLTLD
jgi:hypothetical protein